MLSRDSTRKLIKLLPLLASDQDGEVASAARAITRALAADNLDLHDLARILTSRVTGEDAPNERASSRSEGQADDRRSEVRLRRVLQAGKILLPNGGILDCKLRNRSQHGALLQMASLIGVPDHFVLRIPSTNESFGVETIWRGEHEIGVRMI